MAFRFDYGEGKARTAIKRLHYYQDSTAQRKGMVYSEDFTKTGFNPIVYTMTAGIPTLKTAAVQSVNTTDQIIMPSGATWHVYATTEQAVYPGLLTAGSGIEISLDQVNNEAVEYVPFGNSAYNPFAYTVGTTQPMVFRAAFSFADASGSDQFLLGWRKQEPFAVPTSFLDSGDGTYTDFFGVGFAGTVANPNVVRTAWDVENTGSTQAVSTAFTWADGETHVLEVRLYGAKVKVLINGVPLGTQVKVDGVGTAMTAENTADAGPAEFNAQDEDGDGIDGFNTGDVLIPFIFIRQDADVTGNVFLKAVELGPLSEFGLDPNNE